MVYASGGGGMIPSLQIKGKFRAALATEKSGRDGAERSATLRYVLLFNYALSMQAFDIVCTGQDWRAALVPSMKGCREEPGCEDYYSTCSSAPGWELIHLPQVLNEAQTAKIEVRSLSKIKCSY